MVKIFLMLFWGAYNCSRYPSKVASAQHELAPVNHRTPFTGELHLLYALYNKRNDALAPLKVVFLANERQKIRHYRDRSTGESSTLNPDTIQFRTIRTQSRLNPLPIASTLAQ